ncbi:hypothetical protein E3T40_09565 [Cryobacterium sp. TMT1-19]|uniref:winged helix-turn-helix domain-containing protein n=1 Tax=Cryobacterium sp. TMT1-19 TaxID=1259231 RepID=UPI00106B0FD1|nr:winged helix-turn-helix domain-containing protein [Cryobacterium sp. TMT1-19]TFD34849.1 hypothetical protein E3T40_09565 [Cryobacterium sp. TMT1-19]
MLGAVAAAVGPVTAAPLVAAGIHPLTPERYRMGALIRLVCDHLEQQRVGAPGHEAPVELRDRIVTVPGDQASLAPPSSLTLLRLLLAAGGTVISLAHPAQSLPKMADDHSVAVAISRLRRALPTPGLVATVIKHGYRIDV